MHHVGMVRLAGAHVAVGVAVLYVGGGDLSSNDPSSTTPATVVDRSGCPVEDEAFCEVATEAANALVAGDDQALLALSRQDTIVCDDVVIEYFPQCEAGATLHGYGLSGPQFIVDLVGEEAYVDHLDEITDRVDPAFTDELGDGAVRILGVGTCGPDEPSRRTYHLAWTAAYRSDDGEAERILGSFEFTLDDDWRIALTYAGTIGDWQAEHPDALDEAFCEAAQTPWTS